MTEVFTKTPKAELLARLRARDGDFCMHPNCNQILEFGVDENGDSLAADRMMPTIDHIYPVSRCKEDNWTFEQIWDLSNLQIMHKHCNAKKSNKTYLEDGSLPPSKQRKVLRREKRAGRPELTDCCYTGRLLLPGETCDDCGREAMLHTIPAEYVCRPSECSHSGYDTCWHCYLGFVPRVPAIVTVLDGSIMED